MKCPYCGFALDRVVDSRESKEADAIRRECEGCNKRFTTYERIDEIPYMVVKKDGRREIQPRFRRVILRDFPFHFRLPPFRENSGHA